MKRGFATDRQAAVWIGIFLLCVYALTAGGHYGGDGFWSYLTARSIVTRGDLRVSDHTFSMPEMQRQGDAVAASGREYSKYGLGLPLVEVPFFALGYGFSRALPQIPADYLTMFSTSMTNVMVCALWGVFFFLTARLLRYARVIAMPLTAIFALGTPVFPYSGYGFSEPLMGLGLLLSVYGAMRYRQTGAVYFLALSGAGLGLTALTKLYALIALPVLVLYLWDRRPGVREIVVFVLPLAVAIGLIGWHNDVRYDSFFKTGYHLDDLARHGGYFAIHSAQLLTAFYGLLLSTGRGLIFFVPIACLFPFAYRTFKVAHPREAPLCLGLIICYFVFLLPMIDWHGGSCWGPRYLLPIVPFIALPLGALMASDRRWCRWVWGFGIAGLMAQLPGVLANPHLFVRFAQDKQIGDLIFAPGQTGDLIFSPYLSPILGGYYQIASGITRLFTGHALDYAIASSTVHTLSASLEKYDVLDLWWLHALHTDLPGTAVAAGLAICVIALIAIALYAVHRFAHWQTEENHP